MEIAAGRRGREGAYIWKFYRQRIWEVGGKGLNLHCGASSVRNQMGEKRSFWARAASTVPGALSLLLHFFHIAALSETLQVDFC